jgi:hypothetical protein
VSERIGSSTVVGLIRWVVDQPLADQLWRCRAMPVT